MQSVYTVVYYNTDEVKNSEVIGVYGDEETAVYALIKAAHYEDRNGELYQYKRKSTDYSSFDELLVLVKKEMCLIDSDIYRIEIVKFL